MIIKSPRHSRSFWDSLSETTQDWIVTLAITFTVAAVLLKVAL